MALIDFALTQTCTIHPWLREAAGDDVYGPEETRSCRIQMGAHLRHTYVNPRGVLDQVEARAYMYCTGSKIPIRSKVECEGETYIVVDCYDARGFAGNHLEVYLQ